jgi:pimeloyl-ACP methyl ester carboxylesterase
MKNITLIILFTFGLGGYASIGSSFSVNDSSIVLKTKTGNIVGTLLIANPNRKTPIALIIAGSGPTDRDGNNLMAKNNSLKILSEALARNGISSLRYDKRGIGESRAAGKKEADLSFENYIDDAKEWIDLFKDDKRFSDVTVIGHSRSGPKCRQDNS